MVYFLLHTLSSGQLKVCIMPTRRNFLRTTTATAAGITLIPSWANAGIGRPGPNAQLNLGVIGAGKQAAGIFRRVAAMPNARFVAVCDVYRSKAASFAAAGKQFYGELAGGSGGGEALRQYTDYRELLEHPDLDVVLVTTPDHQHAQMCIDALDRGHHVYCEKPLAHTIEEGRAIVEAVDRSGKVLQTGSMQRSMRPFIRAVELINEGALGDLREALVSIGPPPRPFDLEAQPLPEDLDWSAWIGPSVNRPYHPTIAPASTKAGWAKWRDFAEFGGGMVTDWGAHMFDIVQWARGMDTSGPTQYYPPGGTTDEGITMFYADGFKVTHRRFGRGNAVRFIGSRGTLDVARGFIDSTIPGLVGYSDTMAATKVETLVTHFQDFFDAIRNGSPVICPAETGHRTASVCTLANIAYRLRKPLKWDPEREQITNDLAANKLLGPAYRLSLA